MTNLTQILNSDEPLGVLFQVNQSALSSSADLGREMAWLPGMLC